MNDSTSVIFKDMLFAALAAVIIILVFLINPPKVNDAMQAPGNLIVSVFWPKGSIDVDLWLSAPGEAQPVGFRNKSGKVWNLLRDDLGTIGDLLPTNYENAFSRGMPKGQYTINLVCYTCKVGPFDTIVRVEKKNKDGNILLFKEGKVRMSYSGEQKTFLNFVLNEDGSLQSMNQIQRKLF